MSITDFIGGDWRNDLGSKEEFEKEQRADEIEDQEFRHGEERFDEDMQAEYEAERADRDAQHVYEDGLL